MAERAPHAKTNVMFNKRLCSRCGDFKSTIAGTRVIKKRFVCADCVSIAGAALTRAAR